MLWPVSQFPGSVSVGSCLSGRCFKISKWVPFTYGPCVSQYGVFVLVFRSSEFACTPFRSGFSVPYCSIIFPDIFPIGFQSQVFWALVFPVQDLGVGMPDVEPESLTAQRKDPYLFIPPNCGLLWLRCGFFPWQDCLSLSYLSQCCPFTCCVYLWLLYSF